MLTVYNPSGQLFEEAAETGERSRADEETAQQACLAKAVESALTVSFQGVEQSNYDELAWVELGLAVFWGTDHSIVNADEELCLRSNP